MLTKKQIKDLLAEPDPSELDVAIRAIRAATKAGNLRSRTPKQIAKWAGLRGRLSNSALMLTWHDSMDGNIDSATPDIGDWINTELPEYVGTVVEDEVCFRLAEIAVAAGDELVATNWLCQMAKALDAGDYSCADGVVMLNRLGISLQQALAWK